MSFARGDKLGPYEIVESIGKGGMGEVYRAHDPRTDRDVAIKSSADQFSERFSREVRAIGALNHPNICTLFDVGPNYLVMEYVEGDPLKGPLPFDEAVPLISQLIDGIEAAHEKNIIHRDLKPSNILVTREGVVKILDFGLARTADPPPSGDPELSPTLTIGATTPGTIIGTSAYMSPEQAKGRPADKRSDIWSFAVVVYELLTGKKPFAGESVIEILGSVMHQTPDWASAPPRAHRLLQWCLEKDRKYRLHSISDARRLLLEQAAATPVEVAPPRRRFDYVPWGVAAAGLLVAATLAFVHFRERPPESPVIRTSLLAPEKTHFRFLALSPDGRRLAFSVAASIGKSELWIRNLDASAPQRISDQESAFDPFWSADGRWLGFFEGGKLKRVEITSGGSPLTVCDVDRPLGATWNKDGVILLAEDRGPILKVSMSGGNPTPVTSPNPNEGDSGHHGSPSFLPDGRHFLYSTDHFTTVRVASLDGNGKDSKVLLKNAADAMYSAGYLLFLRNGNLMAQPFNPTTLALGTQSILVSEGVHAMSVSSNGFLAFTKGAIRSLQLAWFERTGALIGTIGEPGTFGPLSLSGDGKSAAVTIRDDQSKSDVWIADLKRGLRSRFTFGQSDDYPAWSPDGAAIVFRSARQGHGDLYRKAVDGQLGSEELLFADNVSKAPLSLSPGGKYLLYAATSPKTKGDLWVLPLSGDRKPFAFANTEFSEIQGVFSPDGHWIAYVSDESGRAEVYAAPFPGPGRKTQISSKQEMTGQGGVPNWSPDGKTIFYIAPNRDLMAVDVAVSRGVLEAGTARRVFGPVPGVGGRNYDVGPDGRFLSYTTPQLGPSEVTLVQNWTAALQK